MNGPSLQRFTILSCIFHISLFAGVFLIARQSANFVIPPPYVVNLVGSEPEKAAPEDNTKVVTQSAEQKEKEEKKAAVTQKSKTMAKTEEQRIAEQIEALKAKKKLETIQRLRRTVSAKKESIDVGKALPPQGVKGKGEGSIMDDYYTRITKKIWANWGLPKNGYENLAAIVSIRIMKNGSVQILGFEKKSGNPLFDRSAVEAINRSNPLMPPPFEMEIGVRFYP